MRSRTPKFNMGVSSDSQYAKILDEAQAFLEAGMHNEAQEKLSSLMSEEVQSNDRSAFLFASRIMAFASARKQELEEAKTFALKALALDDSMLDFYYLLVYVCTRLEDYTLVDLYGRKFIEVRSGIEEGHEDESPFTGTFRKAHEVLNNIGVALREEGHLQDAVLRFEQAIQFEPDYPVAFINLARLAEHNGQRDDAIQILDRALTSCSTKTDLQMFRDSLESGKPEVSLCMIVKNEEDQLPRALKSVEGLADEVIVVDTGSSDRTVEIAESFGAKVYHHKWEKDFSKARNQSLSYATKEWIFILDADEEVVREDIPVIKEMLAQKKHDLLSISVYNVSEDESFASFLPSIRFFRRKIGACYDGIVHNQLKFDEARYVVLRGSARIKHYGYSLAPELMKRKIERSTELLLKQLEVDPNDPFANMNLAQLYRGQSPNPSPELCDKIITHAQRVVYNTDPMSRNNGHLHLMALHQLASACFFKGEFEDSRDHCLKALEYRSDYLDPIITLGHIYSQMENWSEAARWFHRYLDAREKFDHSAETQAIILLNYKSEYSACYGLGRAYARLDNSSDAIKWYRKTLEYKEPYLDTHLKLAELLYNDGQYDDAISCGLQHLKNVPTAWPAHYILGESYRMLGRANPAELHLKKADDMQPGNRDILHALAGLYYGTDRLQEADRYADRLISQFPDFEHAARLIGDIKYAVEDFDAAARAYEQCAFSGTADTELWNNLGNSYFKLERYSEAEKCYRNALKLSPGMAMSARNLGVSLAKSGQTDKAAEALSSYLELVPDDLAVAHLLGDIMMEKGLLDSALKMYELCISLEPESHILITKISDVYYKQGSQESARLGYLQALKLKPSYEPARAGLAAIEGSKVENT